MIFTILVVISGIYLLYGILTSGRSDGRWLDVPVEREREDDRESFNYIDDDGHKVSVIRGRLRN